MDFLGSLLNRISVYWEYLSPYFRFVAPYIAGVCTPWLTRRFRMPKLEVIGARETARPEENLRWWHIVVKMSSPWFFETAEVDGCRAFVRITNGNGYDQNRRFAWRTERGPSASSGKIEPGDEYFIPVTAKSGEETFPLRGLNGRYILSNRLVHITDSDGLVNGNEVDVSGSTERDSLSPGLYRLQVRLLKGRKRLDKGKATFYLVVPQSPEDMDGLRIYPSW